jgi:hypothetical protein
MFTERSLSPIGARRRGAFRHRTRRDRVLDEERVLVLGRMTPLVLAGFRTTVARLARPSSRGARVSILRRRGRV